MESYQEIEEIELKDDSDDEQTWNEPNEQHQIETTFALNSLQINFESLDLRNHEVKMMKPLLEEQSILEMKVLSMH